MIVRPGLSAILIRLRISRDVVANKRPEAVGIDETLVPLRLHSYRLIEITDNCVIAWSEYAHADEKCS
jgi:hypothetical protein